MEANSKRIVPDFGLQRRKSDQYACTTRYLPEMSQELSKERKRKVAGCHKLLNFTQKVRSPPVVVQFYVKPGYE